MLPDKELLRQVCTVLLQDFRDWSEVAHCKYPLEFRQQVFLFLLIAKKFNLYKDVRQLIVRWMANTFIEDNLKEFGKPSTFLQGLEKKKKKWFFNI